MQRIDAKNDCFLRRLSIGILKAKKQNVSETGSLSIHRWGEGALSLLGPLERANFDHWGVKETIIFGSKQIKKN
jgi:hypothetical protein